VDLVIQGYFNDLGDTVSERTANLTALNKLAASATPILPILLEGMRSEDSNLRYRCRIILEAFGQDASGLVDQICDVFDQGNINSDLVHILCKVGGVGSQRAFVQVARYATKETNLQYSSAFTFLVAAKIEPARALAILDGLGGSCDNMAFLAKSAEIAGRMAPTSPAAFRIFERALSVDPNDPPNGEAASLWNVKVYSPGLKLTLEGLASAGPKGKGFLPTVLAFLPRERIGVLNYLASLGPEAAPATDSVLEIALGNYNNDGGIELAKSVLESIGPKSIAALEALVRPSRKLRFFGLRRDNRNKIVESSEALRALELLLAIAAKQHIIPKSTRNLIRSLVKRPTDKALSVLALKALGGLSDCTSDDLRTVIKAISSQDEETKIAACKAVQMAGIKTKAAVAALCREFEVGNFSVRREAANALVGIGGAKITRVFKANLANWFKGPMAAQSLARLEWKPSSVDDKAYFYVALRDREQLMSNEAFLSVLIEDLQSGDRDEVDNAVWALVGLGANNKIKAMIETLEVTDSKTLAESYLNAGHDPLEEAARSWAARNGYDIRKGDGANPAQWGSFR